MSSSSSSTERVAFRAQVLSRHLHPSSSSSSSPRLLEPRVCLQYSPAELSESIDFDTKEMRKLMDDHNLEDRDWLYGLIIQSNLFNPRDRGGKVFVGPDYNQSKEQQRVMTMKRIEYLAECGVFKGYLTYSSPPSQLRRFALQEVADSFDHSLSIKIGVHFFLWYVYLFVPITNSSIMLDRYYIRLLSNASLSWVLPRSHIVLQFCLPQH